MEAPSESDRCILEDGTQQVHLNVAGHLHTTSLDTLKAVASSRLADTFAGSWKLRRTGSGEVFIDRDGEVGSSQLTVREGSSLRQELSLAFPGQAFGIILQYLRAERDSRLFVVPCLSKGKLAQLKEEANYYGLPALHDIISAGMYCCCLSYGAPCNPCGRTCGCWSTLRSISLFLAFAILLEAITYEAPMECTSQACWGRRSFPAPNAQGDSTISWTGCKVTSIPLHDQDAFRRVAGYSAVHPGKMRESSPLAPSWQAATLDEDPGLASSPPAKTYMRDCHAGAQSSSWR